MRIWSSQIPAKHPRFQFTRRSTRLWKSKVMEPGRTGTFRFKIVPSCGPESRFSSDVGKAFPMLEKSYRVTTSWLRHPDASARESLSDTLSFDDRLRTRREQNALGEQGNGKQRKRRRQPWLLPLRQELRKSPTAGTSPRERPLLRRPARRSPRRRARGGCGTRGSRSAASRGRRSGCR